MDKETMKIYSEVYSVLNMLGVDYINKIPKNLYKLIETNRLKIYNPKYNFDTDLYKQNINRKSLAMIALFHINYWCKSEEEKSNLKKIFNENERKYQKELKKKYNPDNIFKDDVFVAENNQNEILVNSEKNILKKIVEKVKKLFKN